jgi:hypothetical protein
MLRQNDQEGARLLSDMIRLGNRDIRAPNQLAKPRSGRWNLLESDEVSYHLKQSVNIFRGQQAPMMVGASCFTGISTPAHLFWRGYWNSIALASGTRIKRG